MQFNKETPVGSFQIQNLPFNIPKPFAEGHVCSVSEAGALEWLSAYDGLRWRYAALAEHEEGSS